MSRPFRLLGLLRLRSMEQDRAAADLAAANAKTNTTAARRTAARIEVEKGDTEPTDARSLLAIAASRNASRALLSDLDALAVLDQREVEAARETYRLARAKTVGLEKLQARHTAETTAEELRGEQNALDEISSAARHYNA